MPPAAAAMRPRGFAAGQRGSTAPRYTAPQRGAAPPSENPDPGTGPGSAHGGRRPKRAGSASGGLTAAERAAGRAAGRERRAAADAARAAAAGGQAVAASAAPQFYAEQLLPADSLLRIDVRPLARAEGRKQVLGAAAAGGMRSGLRSEARSRGAKGGQEHAQTGRHIRSRPLPAKGAAQRTGRAGVRVDWPQTVVRALIRSARQEELAAAADSARRAVVRQRQTHNQNYRHSELDSAFYEASSRLQDENAPRKRFLPIQHEDMYEKVFLLKPKKLHVFLLDTSGSMSSFQRMKETKTVLLSLMERYYQKRELFALLCFRHNRAELALTPTLSLQHARRVVDALPTGGSTPLALGLRKGQEWLRRWLGKEKDLKPHLLLLTDGRLSSSTSPGQPSPLAEALEQAGRLAASAYPITVIDTEAGRIRLGLARQLADALHAEQYFALDELKL